MQICPSKSINMLEDHEGFLYPHIDSATCIKCSLCTQVCPIPDLLPKQNSFQIAYAAYCKDNQIRQNSSSGGIFSMLANEVIKEGGKVFGAVFNEDFSVAHSIAEREEEVSKLRTSKYVQSSINNSYINAKLILETGKKVLFTGTPCQIAGLRKYLNKEYDNLITQDIICHGIPSPLIWNMYVRYREEKAGARTKEISFRHKETGWSKFSMFHYYSNNMKYIKPFFKDPMMRSFLANFSLRPACYHCAFKGKHRVSDITLGDFWGIKNIVPEMNDDRGTSLVIINSIKGANLFAGIGDSIIQQKVDIDKSIQYNPSMVKSALAPEKRDAFFREISSGNFPQIVKKYCGRYWIIRTRKLASNVKKRILLKIRK